MSLFKSRTSCKGSRFAGGTVLDCFTLSEWFGGWKNGWTFLTNFFWWRFFSSLWPVLLSYFNTGERDCHAFFGEFELRLVLFVLFGGNLHYAQLDPQN